MKISLKSESIEINYIEGELKSSHIGQLMYFGYKKSRDKSTEYCYTGQDLIEIAIRTYKYLCNHSLNIELSKNLEDALEVEFEKKVQFDLLKATAREYKDGNFDNNAFTKFVNYTESLPRKLKHHQLKSAYHHYLLHNSADFSVPGSGKTTTLLTVYEALRRENKVNCIFVVGPISSFSAWKNEFRLTLGRIPSVKILSGMLKQDRINSYYDFSNKTELYITSFQSFTNDFPFIRKFFSHPSNKVFFVVDEAHYIKQVNGRWASAILNAGISAESKHVLTGTPCPKSYSDLFKEPLINSRFPIVSW